MPNFAAAVLHSAGATHIELFKAFRVLGSDFGLSAVSRNALLRAGIAPDRVDELAASFVKNNPEKIREALGKRSVRLVAF